MNVIVKMNCNCGCKTRASSPDVNSWLVFIVICLVTMLDFGIIFAFGATFMAMMDTFGSDRPSTATVQSLLVGISLSFSVVSGALISKVGLLKATWVSAFLVPFGFIISFFVTEIQHLYITISITSGIGISTIHVISIVVIQSVFPQRLHPVCFALHGLMVNIAGILYPLGIERLLDSYGLRGTFLILGGIFMNTLTAPLLLSKNTIFRRAEGKHEIESDRNIETTQFLDVEHVKDDQCCDTQRGVPNFEIISKPCNSSLLTKQYLFLLCASALCIPALNTFLALTVDIFVWKGLSVHQSMFSFLPFNVFSMVAKFIPVLAKKITKRLSNFVLLMCFCISGILSQLVVYVSASYSLMLVGTSLVGLSLGGVFPTMLIAAAKIVSKNDCPVASGLLMTVIGALSSGFGPLFGLIRDESGTYATVILTIGIMQAIGGVLYMLALISRKQALEINSVSFS